MELKMEIKVKSFLLNNIINFIWLTPTEFRHTFRTGSLSSGSSKSVIRRVLLSIPPNKLAQFPLQGKILIALQLQEPPHPAPGFCTYFPTDSDHWRSKEVSLWRDRPSKTSSCEEESKLDSSSYSRIPNPVPEFEEKIQFTLHRGNSKWGWSWGHSW